MASENIYSRIKNYGIIPEVKIKEAANAVPLAETLVSVGLDIAEIDLGVQYAERSIQRIADIYPDMLLVAGNAATEDQVKSAIDSGAKAVASLGPFKNAAAYCVKNGIPAIVECENAKDIKKAADAGAEAVKCVVADNNAGMEKLNKLTSEYPGLKFVLRGEITENNLADCLLCEGAIACGMSVICEENEIAAREFGKIKYLASRAIYKMLGFEFAHVVINCENTEQADRDSSKVESIFGLKKTDGENSVSNAGILHFTKHRSYGKNGQIALSTNFMDRAVFYLKKGGKEFIDESARFNEKDELVSVYLDSIIGGFAFKLINKRIKEQV